MKKNYILISFLFLSLFSKASIHNIYMSCTGITPSTLTAACGDTIKWLWGGCSDSSVSTTIPSCATAWSFPVNSTTGNYEIVVTCAGTYNYRCLGYTAAINVICTTGISQISDPEFSTSVYPNPTNGIFNLQMNEPDKIKELKIINVLSECVYRSNNFQTNTSSNFQIDLSSQPNGIYFINISSEKGTEIKKIIIQK